MDHLIEFEHRLLKMLRCGLLNSKIKIKVIPHTSIKYYFITPSGTSYNVIMLGGDGDPHLGMTYKLGCIITISLEELLA